MRKRGPADSVSRASQLPKFRLIAAIFMTACLAVGSIMLVAGLMLVTVDLVTWLSTGIWPTTPVATVLSSVRIGFFGATGWFGALDFSTALIGLGLTILLAGMILRRIVLHGLRA